MESVYGAKPGGYALYLGAIEPKKNLKRLIEAFLLARLDIPLLLAGPLGWLYNEDLALIDAIASQWRDMMMGQWCEAMREGPHGGGPPVRRNGLWPDAAQALRSNGARIGAEPPPRSGGAWSDAGPLVRRIGYLPRHHVVALLQCARFLVFASIYEGFGLPVLEAMQLGVPVLTSNTGPLPEVAGDAAVLVDPLDVPAMAREIRRLGRDSDLCAELARRGPLLAARFNRAGYQERLAAAYRKAGIEIGSESAATETIRLASNGIGSQQPSWEPAP